MLAGGNNIGTSAGQSVFATLFCGDQTITEHSTTLPVCRLRPTATSKSRTCLAPLPHQADLRNPGAPHSQNLTTGVLGSWFAAGIPDLDDHDRH